MCSLNLMSEITTTPRPRNVKDLTKDETQEVLMTLDEAGIVFADLDERFEEMLAYIDTAGPGDPATVVARIRTQIIKARESINAHRPIAEGIQRLPVSIRKQVDSGSEILRHIESRDT